jgi:hypothetical protein
MTVARSQLVDLDVTSYYHCISRCVRRAFLCGEGYEHRKQWIEDRLAELADIFAVSIAGFAVLDNHLHVVVRLEGAQLTDGWSDYEVVQRWGRLYPPRDKTRKPLPVTEEWIQQRLADKDWVARARKRLGDLGWFMKCLKEPLARMANAEDGVRGHFFEGRYKSIAILDTESLVATCAYVDLNPVAAGMADIPEESEHTSVKVRVDHCREQGRMEELQLAMQQTAEGRTLSPDAARRLEQQLWLCPFSDDPANPDEGSGRRGMISGFSLAQYLQLVDWTGHLVREGKASVSVQVGSILERLGTSVETWTSTLQRLFSRKRLLGIAFAFSRARLQEAAAHRRCRHLANLNGCRA